MVDSLAPPVVPDRICLTDDRRALRLVFGRETSPPDVMTTAATIDVGEQGRVLSIEVEGMPGHPTLLIDVEPPAGDLIRTASVTVTVERAGDGSLQSVVLPRRGAGYEITYPSGNQ